MGIDRGIELSGYGRSICTESQASAGARSDMRRISAGEVHQEELDEASEGEHNQRKQASCCGRSAKVLLLLSLFVSFAALALQRNSLADHEHLVALSSSSAAVQPLLRESRALVLLDVEPRFTDNMHVEVHGLKDAAVHAQVQVKDRADKEWRRVGAPWTLRISSDMMRWISLQRHHPGKGLEGLNWHNHVFDLGAHPPTGQARLLITTNLPKPISLLLRVQEMGPLGRHRWLIALAIVVMVFALIASEAVHRTVAAALGSFAILGTMAVLGERASVAHVASWLDVDTILLLFGMMVLVGYLSSTGFFEFLAAETFARYGQTPRRLLFALCLTTAVMSAFLDNVTTVLLIAPVTVHLCRAARMPPVDVVIAIVLFSNIGGAATLIGDPPNVMIGAQLHGITFTKFSMHIVPVVLACIAASFAYVQWALGSGLRGGTTALLATDTEDEAASVHTARAPRRGCARRSGRGSAAKLARAREMTAVVGDGGRESNVGGGADAGNSAAHAGTDAGADCRCAIDADADADAHDEEEGGAHEMLDARSDFELEVAAMRARYPIKDAALLRVVGPMLVVVVAAFCFASLFELDLAWIPAFAAVAVALLDPNGDLDAVLARVEWSTLLFFGCLSVLMRGVAWLGLIRAVGEMLAAAVAAVPIAFQLPAALVIILWASAIFSSLVDNVPFTAAMIPIIQALASSEAKLPLTPLAIALALGTCLGGNGTIVAASANVVAAGVMQGLKLPLSFYAFFRLGAPVVIITVSISSAYVVLMYVVLGFY